MSLCRFCGQPVPNGNNKAKVATYRAVIKAMEEGPLDDAARERLRTYRHELDDLPAPARVEGSAE